MTDSAADARAAIDRWGHTVTFKRVTGSIPNQTTTTKDCKAIVSGYRPEELVGGITVGSRKVIVSEAALADAGFPVPVKKGDYIIALGREMVIQTVDADRRYSQGVLEVSAAGQ
jgi:hypothetical protein